MRGGAQRRGAVGDPLKAAGHGALTRRARACYAAGERSFWKGSATMAKKRTCETCTHWGGGASSYNGDCGNPRVLHSRTPFDFGCEGYGYAASQLAMSAVWGAVGKALAGALKKPRQP
jgi:hypothetical protein